MERSYVSVTLQELSSSETSAFESEIARYQRTKDGPTNRAELFNDDGTSDKWHIWIELWGEHDDPVNSPPAYRDYVTLNVRAGKIEYHKIPSNVLAVFVAYKYYDSKTKKYYATPPNSPPPIFGPRKYYKESALFWFAKGPDELDQAVVGGLVESLP